MRSFRRKTVAVGVAVALGAAGILAGGLPASAAGTTPAFYTPNTANWLYFGWENDSYKSLSTMGGALYPGGANLAEAGRTPGSADVKPVRYTLTVGATEYKPDETSPQRRRNTTWQQSDGWMNAPESEWSAGSTGLRLRIRHVPARVASDTSTVDYTQVTVLNTSGHAQTATVNVSAPATREVPLTADHKTPTDQTADWAVYDVTVPAGGEVPLDFVASADPLPGKPGALTATQLGALPDFETGYAATKAHFEAETADMALPVTLPDQELANAYLNSYVVMAETMVAVPKGNSTDYEIRGSGGNRKKESASSWASSYFHTYTHDAPNMVEQFIRDGQIDLAERILGSQWYQDILTVIYSRYYDAIPKYFLPYATLWQVLPPAEREAYFTPAIRDRIKGAAHEYFDDYIYHAGDTGPVGLVKSSNTLDNGDDYLLVDNFAAINGYTAYKYLAGQWGWDDEATWAEGTVTSINSALNGMLDTFIATTGSPGYMACLQTGCSFWTRHQQNNPAYDGNWLASSLMTSQFPWDATLKGLDVRGTWSDRFDASLDWMTQLRNANAAIPDGSWGAWWGHLYGSVYNVGQTVPMLYSDKYRDEVVDHYEWLLDAQSAPFQWGESFDKGADETDWTSPAADYESWGLGFLRQGLLEATASVSTAGDVIIGRGIPDRWLVPAAGATVWKDIAINDGRKLDQLSIRATDATHIAVDWTGDDASGDFVVNLPVLAKQGFTASAGVVDAAKGTITLPGSARSVTITLDEPIDLPLTLDRPDLADSTVNGTSAPLSWQPVAGAQTYRVETTTQRSTVDTIVTGTSTTLTNLLPNFTYQVKVRAEAGDVVGPWSSSVYLPVPVPPPGGGSLAAQLTDSPTGAAHPLDLTAQGTTDWVKTDSVRSVSVSTIRKATGGAQIQVFPMYASAVDLLRQPDNNMRMQWSDGDNPVSATGVQWGMSFGADHGQVPVLTQPRDAWLVAAPGAGRGVTRTLKVYTGAWNATERVTVCLVDDSVPCQVLELTSSGGNGAVAADKTVTVTYSAPVGTSVTVRGQISSKPWATGNVWMPAATLSQSGTAVDLGPLQDAVDQADGLDEQAYTPASWTALTQAKAAAESALTDWSATQAQVDDAAQALRGAIAALVRPDAVAPTATVKTGDEFSVGQDGAWEKVSFKLFDAGKVDKVVINGVVKDLSDNVWSDVNGIKPGVFGAALGANTMKVFDVAGNVTTVTFTLVAPVPAWSSTTVYTTGDRVRYGGAVYVAQWWTQGETPGSTSTGAWAEVGAPVTTPQGTYATWTSSWVYIGGETVAYHGHLWKAQWWTRGQTPGQPNGPWQDRGAY